LIRGNNVKKKCRHTVGIEYHKYEMFMVEESEEYWDEKMHWFKYCPRCGIQLKEGKEV
jgi:hypothetical protein